MDKEFLSLVTEVGQVQTYTRGTVLCREGDVVQFVYLIKEGYVKVSKSDPSGKEVISGLRTTGWIVGAYPAILGIPFPKSVVATTDCFISRISTEAFHLLRRSNFLMGEYLQVMLSQEANEQTNRNFLLAGMKKHERLEHFLWDIAVDQGWNSVVCSEITVQFPIQHREVAQLLGMDQCSLSNGLRKLEEKGVIRRQKAGIKILFPEKLFHF